MAVSPARVEPELGVCGWEVGPGLRRPWRDSSCFTPRASLRSLPWKVGLEDNASVLSVFTTQHSKQHRLGELSVMMEMMCQSALLNMMAVSHL